MFLSYNLIATDLFGFWCSLYGCCQSARSLYCPRAFDLRSLWKFVFHENRLMHSPAHFIGAGTTASWEWRIVTVVSLIELPSNKNRYRWQLYHLRVTDSSDLEPSVSDALSCASFAVAVTVMSLQCPAERGLGWGCLYPDGWRAGYGLAGIVHYMFPCITSPWRACLL